MPTLEWQDASGQTVSLTLDVTASETWEDNVTLTDHPVEEGISVTDHAKDEPVTYLVEGIVSNVPMPGQDGVQSANIEVTYDAGADRGTQQIELDVPVPPVRFSPQELAHAGIAAINRSVSGKPKGTFWGPLKRARTQAKASVLQHGTARNRPKEAHDLLLSAKAAKALITVRSKTRELRDLQITRIAASRDTESLETTFQIDLRQIRVAASETVAAPEPVEARGATKTSAGAQSTTKKDETDEEAARSESSLHKIFY
jgi:hypothetical protein